MLRKMTAALNLFSPHFTVQFIQNDLWKSSKARIPINKENVWAKFVIDVLLLSGGQLLKLQFLTRDCSTLFGHFEQFLL